MGVASTGKGNTRPGPGSLGETWRAQDKDEKEREEEEEEEAATVGEKLQRGNMRVGGAKL